MVGSTKAAGGQGEFVRVHHLAQISGWMFLLGVAVVLSHPLFSGTPWMLFVQDDLLYYMKVAQNIAQGHGSTFNQVVPTNGYQPLWLLFLIAFSWFTTSAKALMVFISLCSMTAAGTTFYLASRLIQRSGAQPFTVFALSAWVTIYSVTLFFYAMEVTLTVPITLGLICLMDNTEWLERSPAHTFLLGLLLSAMVLSRIDTLIFGCLLLTGVVATPRLRVLLRPKLLMAGICGLLPLPVYFLLNHRLFHTWLPVSGMAKELKFDHTPSIEPWRVFFHPLAAAFTLVLVLALALLPGIARRLSPMQRVLYPAALVFPFLYYFILSCVSDWTLWGWYMYPIRIAVCISFCIFCLHPLTSRVLNQRWVSAALALSVFASLTVLRWTRQQQDIYEASVELQQFAASHPGTYAMGDRAGRVAYLIPDPVIQTEGLMMDRDYLEYVRRQTPLREVLAHYRVRYYVGTAYTPFSGCFEASEPAKAGPHSAHMRAEFCEQPVATFLHAGIETLVFDVGTPH